MNINANGRLIAFEKPLVMGIINATPDSFYDGGVNLNAKNALLSVQNMVKESVDIIDIGAFSSRPGAEIPSLSEEWERLAPVVEAIRTEFPDIIISVDTFRHQIVERLLDFEVNIINDITGGKGDPELIHLLGQQNLSYIAMHTMGMPIDMQKNISKNNIVHDVMSFFVKLIDECNKCGLYDIVIDPGFGFGKSLRQNYQLMKAIDLLRVFQRPILMGISRKSMIYNILETTTEETLVGSSVLHWEGIAKGAKILRVHDVKAAKQTIELWQYYQNSEIC